MSIKFFRGAVLTMATALPATVHAEETIDAFARAHLKASQEAEDAKLAKANAANAGATSAANTGPAHAGTSARRDIPPELLFIYGVENATVAYLRVDGRYGRNVTKGDKIGQWQVVTIGDDFVDIRRGANQQRLLLPNAFGIAPPSVTQTSQRAPGTSHGDDF